MQTTANQQTIPCPQCGYEVKLTESLAAPLIAEVEHRYQKQMQQQQAAMAAREQSVAARAAALERQAAEAEKHVAAQVRTRLEAERKQLVADEADRARQHVAEELSRQADALRQSEERSLALSAKLKTAQQQEAEFLRQQRALDDERRELKLQIERQVQQQLETVRQQAERQTKEAVQLELQDKEKAIQDLRSQIGDLKRKAEQGSQQAQGEVLEIQAEQQLRARFPLDEIVPVPKGEFGGDLLHTVRDPAGQVCGSILWEFKRTKAWSDGWLAKLRGDQRAAGADLAVLVSQTMPRDITHFDHMGGIWVSSLGCTLPVAIAMRQALIELSGARRAGQGQDTKVQQVYTYLTGPQFRHRMGTIAEKFTDMRADLEQERKFLQRQWAKREKQLELVLEASQGIYGDLQGIAGRSLEEIDALASQMLLQDQS